MRRFLAPPLLLLALTRCSDLLPPYESVPVVLDKNQQQAIANASGDLPAVIGVCYNSLTATAAQVRAIAAQACGPSTVPRALQRDFQLTYCPVLQPARVTFACMAKTP